MFIRTSRSAPLFVSAAIFIALCASYVFQQGFGVFEQDLERHIFLQVRLPIMFTAILVGAALCVSAGVLQVLMRNPLADPGIIGISSGASLIAAVVILLPSALGFQAWLAEHLPYLQPYILPLSCFCGAMLSSVMIFSLAKKLPDNNSAVILAGIAISTICAAIIGWLYLVAPAQAMQSLTFWLMGSLHNADWFSLALVSPFVLLALIYLVLRARELNWLYMGPTNAQLKGLNVRVFESRVLIACALLVGISVSIAGGIAFVGLLVPHFVRRMLGFDNRLVLPVTAITGASVMLLTALLNEQLFDVVVPISMLTASIGGPLFIYSLLKRAGRM